MQKIYFHDNKHIQWKKRSKKSYFSWTN